MLPFFFCTPPAPLRRGTTLPYSKGSKGVTKFILNRSSTTRQVSTSHPAGRSDTFLHVAGRLVPRQSAVASGARGLGRAARPTRDPCPKCPGLADKLIECSLILMRFLINYGGNYYEAHCYFENSYWRGAVFNTEYLLLISIN